MFLSRVVITNWISFYDSFITIFGFISDMFTIATVVK